MCACVFNAWLPNDPALATHGSSPTLPFPAFASNLQILGFRMELNLFEDVSTVFVFPTFRV